ncbi:hypothetical protein KAX02_05565 [candidate division WOR-3 bacterium]|nr:hypothetical protein [candidate division WOR-3 bacterium]
MKRYYGDDIEAVQSALDPDETYYYYKKRHVATLTMSCKDGQVGISFEFVDLHEKDI